MLNCYQFSIFIILYTLFYYKKHVYMPKIYSNNPLMKTLSFTTVYPFYLIPYGFVQSVYQLFRRVNIIDSAVHTSLILPVGEDAEVLLDIYEPGAEAARAGGKGGSRTGGAGKKARRAAKAREAADRGRPARHNILLLHGLNGTSRSTYIRGMANVFLKRNCRVFCYNARGALHPPRSNLISHIGLTSDVRSTVEYILGKYPGDISLIGFSLGSNWVAKLLGEYTNKRITMGVSICCPFDFNYLKTYFRKQNYYARFINYSMCRNYKRYILRSMHAPINLSRCHFLEDIDTELLAIYKADRLDDFYKENSCISHLHNIKTPLLFINTIDDPIIPYDVIPFDKCLQNENIGVAVLKGGHLGFFTNRAETMAEVVVGEFFDKVWCAKVGRRSPAPCK